MTNVTDRMLLESCDLALLDDIDLYVGQKVKYIMYEYKDGIKDGSKRMISDWTIIKANSPEVFGAIALKMDKEIIIAYTSSGNIQDIFDWIGNIKVIYKDHPYSDDAIKFASDILQEHKDINKIYITGHSLGGYLSQVVAYHLYNKVGFKNIGVVTFNSLGSTAPNHINQKYQLPIINKSLNIYFYKFIIIKNILINIKNIIRTINIIRFINYLDKKVIKSYEKLEEEAIQVGGIIDKENYKWNEFCIELDNIAKNYYVDADPIYTILGTKNIGNNIVLKTEYKLGMLNDGSKAHKLDNFYYRI